MQAIRLKKPGGLDHLVLSDIEAVAPGPGEIQVDIKASSLNFHDYAVVAGMIPALQAYRKSLADGLSQRL